MIIDIAKDGAFWEKVRTDDDYSRFRDEIRKKYDEVFSEEKPRPRSAKEILENNDHAIYFRSLRQLQTAALMALIYQNDEIYYDNLVDIVWAYLNDYSWAPLGHYNEYYDRTPMDYDPTLIDIFAASNALSLAEIKYLFKDRFPKLLIDRITAEIKRRVIDSYVSRRFFWEHHDNNWTAVCTGAVGCVLMYEAPDIFWQQKERLDKSMECYLNSYKDDGMCVEGIGYWGFGFGFFTVYALELREFSQGKYDYFKLEKVKAISKFLQKMFLQRDVIASYGDCNNLEGFWVGLPHILRSIYGNEIEKLPIKRGGVVTYTHLAFSLRSLVYYNPEFVATDIDNDVVYSEPGCCYFTKRAPGYGFTAKGGNNGESHNHNDVGSFILARHNKEILCDLGYIGPCKSDGYHGNRRYEYFNTQSFSHNLPYFNGIPQDGIRRDDVFAVYNEKDSTVYMNFTGGYGIKELRKAERLFKLNNNSIILTDSFDIDPSYEITERFISVIKPDVSDNSIIIDDVKLLSDIKPRIVEKDYVAQVPIDGNYNQICYCIEYVLPKGINKFILNIEIPD